MTSTIARAEILKQDVRGRVRVPVERQQALLDEFEKSGASGAKFARLAGIKYATFAGWVLKRRKQRGRLAKPTLSSPAGLDDAVVSAGSVRLFEALVEGDQTPSLPGTARRPTRFRRGAVKSKFLAGGKANS